jgi:hypothetical protein
MWDTILISALTTSYIKIEVGGETPKEARID